MRCDVRRFTVLVLVLLAAPLQGCGNAGEDLGFGTRKSGPGIRASVYFDADNSGDNTGPPEDLPAANIPVRLFLGATAPREVGQGTTLASGDLSFVNIQTGAYHLEIDAAFLSDSIVATSTPASATVTSQGDTVVVNIGLAPPVFTARQVRTGLLGKVVIVTGVVSAGRRSYSDTSAYLADTSGALRLQKVVNLNGLLDNDPGDDVRVRGRISVFHGQRVLDSARVFLVRTVPAPVAEVLTTGPAAQAVGGTKEAALIQVVNATIADTATVGGAFVAGVNDGSGRLELLIDPAVSVLTSIFAPGAHVDAIGVLVPRATGGWQLWPRSTADYLLH
jgi:hypothetical protein